METVLDEVCASCGSDRLADGRFCLFCGDLLSDPSPRKSSPSRAAGSLRQHSAIVSSDIEYAGFWRRFWAGSIDLAIEATGALVLTYAIDLILRTFGRGFGIDPWDSKVFTGVAFILILAVGSWLYCAFAESSAWQATIGKRLLGVRVISADGSPTSFGQATVRHFMKFLSLFCLMIGFMMSGWTKRRQALHDMPCDCLVVRTR